MSEQARIILEPIFCRNGVNFAPVGFYVQNQFYKSHDQTLPIGLNSTFNAFDKNRSWLNFTLSPCNTPKKYERNYRGNKRHFLFSSIMHYALWAREGVTLRISELFLLFEADPNISDGNSILLSLISSTPKYYRWIQ